MRTIRKVTALNAVTATTTSEIIDLKYAKKVSIMLTASGITSGNGVFTIDGSLDGSTFITMKNIIDNVINSNVQTLARIGSKTLNANGSQLITLDMDLFPLESLKITVTKTTDGTYSAYMFIVQEELD